MVDQTTVKPEAGEHDATPASVKAKAVEASQEPGQVQKKSAEKIFEEGRRYDKNGKPIRDFVSVGEKIHNEIAYRGVDWLLNSAFGVAFGFWSHRTEVGRKYFAQPVEKFFTKAMSPIFKGDALKGAAEWGGTFVSIMFGGTVTIPPLMYLENPKHKVPFIKRLDTWIYGQDKVENDPKFTQAYDEIKHQPKKDFWTGLYTRFIALAPLLAVTVYAPTNKFIKKNFYDHIARGTTWVGEKLGMGEKGYWGKMDAHGNEGVPISHWKYLHRTIAFDFGLTILYSFLHEAAYKLFAKKKDDARNRKLAEKLGTIAEKPSTRRDEAEVAAPSAESNITETKPLATVSDIAAREVLKPVEQQQYVQA